MGYNGVLIVQYLELEAPSNAKQLAAIQKFKFFQVNDLIKDHHNADSHQTTAMSNSIAKDIQSPCLR
jgi:hypothetical protein